MSGPGDGMTDSVANIAGAIADAVRETRHPLHRASLIITGYSSTLYNRDCYGILYSPHTFTFKSLNF